MSPALKELSRIIELEDSKDRQQAFVKWAESWVDNYYENQLFIDYDKLDTKRQDAFKIKLSRDLALKLLETCVIVDVAKRKLTAEFSVIRKRRRKK